jgi:hypothetical protein
VETETPTPSATATSDNTGGENETPVTSPTTTDPAGTATAAVSDLPDTGSAPGTPGGQGLLASIVVALVLVGIGFHLRRQAVRLA